MFTVAFAGMCRADTEVNIASPASGVKVYASSAPNPAWPPEQVNDGKIETNHGWLGSADQGTPWIAFEFDAPKRVSGVVFYQAGLTEGGPRRFARPKQLRINFDNAPAKTVELQDAERTPQKVEFDAVEASAIKIDVVSTYDNAKFPFLTGFQEIEIYSGSIKAKEEGAETKPAPAEPQPPQPVTSKADDSQELVQTAAALTATVANTLDKDGLDDDERELLNLLAVFTQKLEEYFKKKNKQ